VLPATLHNFAASRDLVLVNSTGGFTFFLGNNPEATGLATYPSGVNSDPLLEESQSARLAEISSGRALKPSEASSFWFRKGLRFIVARPLRWLGLTGLKFWLFWNRYEIPDNYDIQFIVRHFNTILSRPLISFALVGSLGAAGLFLCRIREASGLPFLLFLAYLFSILPFLISDRYRLPGVVFLLPLAAAAAERLAVALTKLEGRAVWKLLLPASPLILLCLSRAPIAARSDEAAGWGQLTAVYAGRGDFQLALEAFQRAAALAPESINETAIDSAAFSLRSLNRPEEALDMYEEGSRIYPESAILYNNRAALLFQLGRTKEGVELLERSLKADPDPGLQYKNLFYACARLGRNEKALRYGTAAAARFPGDMELQRGLRELKRKTRGSK
jgi:tetratricopeptide (TPR) repeat protein